MTQTTTIRKPGAAQRPRGTLPRRGRAKVLGRRFPARSGGFSFWVALLFGLLSNWCEAQPSKEYQIKAVVLLNLTRFVDWPPAAFSSPDSPIVIGILGRDPFGLALEEAVNGEKVNGRKIVLERFASLKALRPCHLLFISKSERSHISAILAAVNGRSILTVSEVDNFSSSLGGMVRLYTNDRSKIRLNVNLEATRAENLKLSSKLLQVAEVTRK